MTNLIGSKPSLFKDKINGNIQALAALNPIKMHKFGKLIQKYKKFHFFNYLNRQNNNQKWMLEIVRKKHKMGLLDDNKSAIPKSIVKKLKWEKIPISLVIL